MLTCFSISTWFHMFVSVQKTADEILLEWWLPKSGPQAQENLDVFGTGCYSKIGTRPAAPFGITSPALRRYSSYFNSSWQSTIEAQAPSLTVRPLNFGSDCWSRWNKRNNPVKSKLNLPLRRKAPLPGCCLWNRDPAYGQSHCSVWNQDLPRSTWIQLPDVLGALDQDLRGILA